MVGVGALAGCTAPTTTTTPAAAPTGLPAGVSVSILQNRDDYGPRRLEIAISNTGTSDITVTKATFDSPHFTTDAAAVRGTDVPSGSTRNLPVTLGVTTCDPGAGDDTVHLAYTLADGTAGTATVTPTSPFHAIETVVAQDCALELTSDHVQIALAGAVRTEQREGHPVALLDVTFTPTGAAGSATITDISRTILLRPADGTDAWPVGATFSASSAPLTVTLDVVPANCRLHTVTEDKRGTYFPFSTTTDAGPGLFYLASSNAVKEEFYAYIADYCGWDGSTPLD